MSDQPFIGPFSSRDTRALVHGRAEQALLGALIVKPSLLAALPANFHPDHYGSEWHGDIHRILVEVGQPGGPAGILIMHALGLNDSDIRAYIPKLLTAFVTLTPSSIHGYAEVVTDLYRRRRLVALSEGMRESAFKPGAEASADSTIAQAMGELEEMTGQAGSVRPHIMIAEAADMALRRADKAAQGGGFTGMSTGYQSIDEALGGLEAGTVTVLAGRPGMGKSALGHKIALNGAAAGHGVLEISLEMTAAALGARALSALSGVPLQALRHGRHASSMDQLMAARRQLTDLPLSIEDGGGLTAGMIGIRARAAKRRHGLKLIMVDHLHIVQPDDSDTRQSPTWAVGRVSLAMQRLAKDQDCAVLLLAQLSRGVESRDDKRPVLSDLRQAGDIEQNADAVAFVYRAEYYLGGPPEKATKDTREQHANRVTEWERDKERLKGKAELILGKVRDGEPCTVRLEYDGPTTSFTEPCHADF